MDMDIEEEIKIEFTEKQDTSDVTRRLLGYIDGFQKAEKKEEDGGTP